MGKKLKQSAIMNIKSPKNEHEEHIGLLKKTKKNKIKIKHLKRAEYQDVQLVRPKKKEKMLRELEVSMDEENDNNVVQHVKLKKKKKFAHIISQTSESASNEDTSIVEPIKARKPSKKKSKKLKAIQADNNVVTSESESANDDYDEAGAEKPKVTKDAVEKSEAKPDEETKEKRFPGPEHSIFIGNLPTTVKKSSMKALFMQFGKILTVRFRTHDGAELRRKKDRQDAKALNCYIRFESKKEAEAACAMNGHTVEGNYIRVSMDRQKQFGHIASTVFVGNIHRRTTDNELYDFFSRVGDIEYVRQIANKGIGYVCFKKGVSIAKALKLNQQLLNGRPLRIMKVDPNRQSKRKNKKGNLVSKNQLAIKVAKPEEKKYGGIHKNSNHEFHGKTVKPKNGKKQKPKQPKNDKKKILAQKLMAAGSAKKISDTNR